MKKVLKYSYLTIGLIHYIIINYISYNISPYNESFNIYIKVSLSILSLLLLLITYYLIYIFDIKDNKKYELKIESKVFLYIFVILISLISLIN